MSPEQLLRQHDPRGALQALQEQVRAQPANPKLRIFLFQLQCVLGQWERARTQLQVLSDLDASTLPMVEMYGGALVCEAFRREVFNAGKTPLVLGEPPAWLALLLQALQLEAGGNLEHAAGVRAQALEQAAAVAGTVDGVAFEWIADADARLGPVCELILNGKYYWVPFERLKLLAIEAPEDLRDAVWLPAQVRFANGGESVALVPARYPGCESEADGALQLGRKTEWNEVSSGVFHGRGLRWFCTDADEYSISDVRRIELRPEQGS
jgi:type VI secretion system protein ImpE